MAAASKSNKSDITANKRGICVEILSRSPSPAPAAVPWARKPPPPQPPTPPAPFFYHGALSNAGLRMPKEAVGRRIRQQRTRNMTVSPPRLLAEM